MKSDTAKIKAKLREKKEPVKPPTKGLNSGSRLLNLAITGRVSFGVPCGSFILFVGDTNSGKAQPSDAKVLTPDGWKFMGNMVAGDYVIDPDGGGTGRVVDVFPQGRKEIFKIVFSDGSETRCCDDHLWLVKRTSDGGRTSDWEIRTLKEIRSNLKTNNGRPRYRIPAATSTSFYEKESLPIDPYLMGTLLGNGLFGQSSVGISSIEPEIINRLKRTVPKKLRLRHDREGDYRICGTKRGHGTKNEILTKTRTLKLSGCRAKSKFIPKIYLRASIADRVHLLNGLMDTDGYASKEGSAIYSTISRKLMKGVVELVRSLGGRASVREKDYTYNNEERTSYDVLVIMPSDIPPFTLKRKADRYNPNKKRDRLSRKIMEVKPDGVETCQCISVSTKRGLYITDDYVVTHNTYVTLGFLAEASIDPAFAKHRLIYVAVEDGALMDMRKHFGEKMANKIEVFRVSTVEEFYYLVDDLLDEGKPFVLVLDSQDALDSEASKDKFQEQKAAFRKGKQAAGSYGDGKPKIHSSNLRVLHNRVAKTESIVCFISQTRDNIGFGAQFQPKTRSGGHALEFYADAQLWSSIKQKIKVKYKGNTVQQGILCKIQVKRSRYTGREVAVEIPIYWSTGLDDAGSMVNWLIHWGHWRGNETKVKSAPEFGVTAKKGKSDDDEDEDGKGGVSKEELIQTIVRTDGGEKKLRMIVAEVWRDIEAATAVQRQPRYS